VDLDPMTLWRMVCETESAFYDARIAFVQGVDDRVAVIRSALGRPTERGTALRLLLVLSSAEREALLDELVEVASVGHSDVQLCRDVILSLPREGLVEKLAPIIERLLQSAGDEEHRRLLELAFALDAGLTRQIAERAARSNDLGTREAGEDFLENLREAGR
jgi:hypothetical protein